MFSFNRNSRNVLVHVVFLMRIYCLINTYGGWQSLKVMQLVFTGTLASSTANIQFGFLNISIIKAVMQEAFRFWRRCARLYVTSWCSCMTYDMTNKEGFSSIGSYVMFRSYYNQHVLVFLKLRLSCHARGTWESSHRCQTLHFFSLSTRSFNICLNIQSFHFP